MLTLEDYMELPYRMEIIKDMNEGGYVVSFPDLPGCLTCGETIESAIANAEDALEFMMAGATGVAVGAMNFINHYTTVETVEGIERFMEQQKIDHITDIIGCVK